MQRGGRTGHRRQVDFDLDVLADGPRREQPERETQPVDRPYPPRSGDAEAAESKAKSSEPEAVGAAGSP